MSIRDDIKRICPGSWVFVGLAFVLLWFLNVSWLKWGNLIVDSYRDAWLAENLLKGKLLYKDLFCEYGFLPYYLLAAVFKIFGATSISIVFSGIVITAAVSFSLYKTARLFFDEIVSGLVVFTFLAVFAFGNYQQYGIFNFILPYSIAATIFCMSCTASLYFFLKFIISNEIIWLKVWAALYGFTFLCRPDIPLVCWAGMAVALLPSLWQNRHNRVLLCSCLFAPLFFAILSYAIFFNITGSLPDFYRHTIKCILMIKGNPFNMFVMGLDHLYTNLFRMFLSFVLSLAAVGLIAGGCILVHRGTTIATASRFAVYGGGLLILAAFFSGIFWPENVLQYNCLTLVLLINMFYGIYCLKKNINARTAGAIFALSVVSMTLIVRVIFNPGPFLYGFYLVVAAIPAYYLFFFHILGGGLKKNFPHFPEALFNTVLVIFFVMQAYLWWHISQSNYSEKTAKIVFSRGTVYKGTAYAVNDAGTQDYINAVRYLDENTRPDQTLVVFPEGISMNFFTGLYNPVGNISFLPTTPTTVGYITEKEIIESLVRYKVDYVVLLTRYTSKYGPTCFGKDYAINIAEWVRSSYDLVRLFGDYPYTSQRGGIALYKRRVVN